MTLRCLKFKAGVYDIKMPKMNGFQLFRNLRNLDNKLKICFLSATDLAYYRGDLDVINDLGTDCFIAKPVVNEDIAVRLKAILSQK